MMNTFFYVMFAANIGLFLFNLWLQFIYKPSESWEGVTKSWTLTGFVLALSIMAMALFWVSFFGVITPGEVLLTDPSGNVYTTSVQPSDAPVAVALLMFVNVIFALNVLFCIIGFLKELRLFVPKRFK